MDEQKQKELEQQFLKDKENVTKGDVERAIIKVQSKFASLGDDVPGALKNMWEDIKDMWGMLKDYWADKYTNVPWGTIAAIVVALLYFASPIDIIPDFIPVLGYIDDVFIITLAIKMVGSDIEDYRKWRDSQQVS